MQVFDNNYTIIINQVNKIFNYKQLAVLNLHFIEANVIEPNICNTSTVLPQLLLRGRLSIYFLIKVGTAILLFLIQYVLGIQRK